MLRIALRVRLRYAPLRMTHRGIVLQYFIAFNNLIRHSFVVTPSPTGEGYRNLCFQQQIGANQELKVTNLLASLKREVALRSNDGRSFLGIE